MKDLWKIEMALGADKTSARLSIGGYIAKRWWADDMGITAAADVKAKLEELPESVKTIVVELNSRGGEVSEGIEIYEALVGSGRTVEVNVVGEAFSIATVILLAGSVRRISAMGQVMIHQPTGYAYGTAKQMRASAERLEKTTEQVLDLYESKTKLSRKDLMAALEKDTFYTAKEAVANGFATEILEAASVPATSNVMRLPDAQERTLASLGWQVPAVAAFFGEEPNQTETDEMNMTLMKSMAGIFGADRALQLCDGKPEAKSLADFETEMAAHVADLNKKASDAQAKVTALEAEKATMAGDIAKLQDQVKDLGKAPVVVQMNADPAKPADKPGVCPAHLSGKEKASWMYDNTPAIQAEFGGDKAAAMAYAETNGWNL